MHRLSSAAALACAALALAAPATAQHADPTFKAETFVCPHTPQSGLDCYLDAVQHLYTMCRNVKSIEIIEFGHAKAQEGVNGAKSEYCVDKQKQNIVKPYQTALKEATGWREAVEALRSLQAYWLESMANLTWKMGEAADAYDDRVHKVYDEFSIRIESVRQGFTTAPDDAAARPAAARAAPAKAAAPAAKSKTN